jgi:hypothetical protein
LRNSGHYYLSFIKHYLSATLIDVLHSPFVFRLYNQCIRKKSLQHLDTPLSSDYSYFSRRINEVLLKYILQYKPDKIYVARNAEKGDFADALHSYAIPFSHTLPFQHCGILYLGRVPDIPKLYSYLPHLQNDSVIVVEHLYDTKAHTDAWNALKGLPEITVTVDLFFAGLVFIRRQQRKQDFKLRLF